MTATFITATGTDIGKTFLATGMIRYFRDGKIPIDALKPVATGFDDDAPESVSYTHLTLPTIYSV